VVIPSVTVNQIVKVRFKFPRPPQQARHPLAYTAPGDFTFPSGHAQNAVVLGLFLALQARRRWVRVLGLSLALSIPLSRVYLGVHYPRDVLAGALLGVGTLAAVKKLERPFRRWWKQAPRGSRGFALSIGTSIAALLTGNPLSAFPLAVGGGLALGQDLSGQHRFVLDEPMDRRQRITQGAIGVGLFLSVGFAVRPLVKRESASAATLAGQLVGVALTFGVPLANDLTVRYRLWRRRRRSRRAGRRPGRRNR
jgi:undecaprenyl-diphosphatase